MKLWAGVIILWAAASFVWLYLARERHDESRVDGEMERLRSRGDREWRDCEMRLEMWLAVQPSGLSDADLDAGAARAAGMLEELASLEAGCVRLLMLCGCRVWGWRGDPRTVGHEAKQ